MSPNGKSTRRKWSLGCLAVFGAVLLIYLAALVLLRTPPVAGFQNIAHRGGTVNAPENTLAAFRDAIAQGVDWLEFDVQMTQDGALVVIHDETIDRTTNGSGAVGDLTLAQIRALDAGQGEKIPTFDEVVALAKASGMKILPETKSAHLYPGVEAKLLKALEQAGYLDQAVIQSFEADSLNELHRLNPAAKLCALSGKWQFKVSAPAGEAQYVCPMAEMVLLDPWMVRQAHKAGRQVFTYFGIIEKPWMFSLMRFFGVDGLIVNDPAAVK